MDRYKVSKVYKTGTRRTVETGLTRDEAKRMVAKDLKVNPKALRYMMVFDKQ